MLVFMEHETEFSSELYENLSFKYKLVSFVEFSLEL